MLFLFLFINVLNSKLSSKLNTPRIMILLIVFSSKYSSYLILICLCVVFNGATKILVDLKLINNYKNTKEQFF